MSLFSSPLSYFPPPFLCIPQQNTAPTYQRSPKCEKFMLQAAR
jgi:hypothetical protein